MGLQFIDSDGSERTLVEADMALGEFRDSYSDLFKSLHGFRPRGEYFWNPGVMLRFFDTYEGEMEAELERQRDLDEYLRVEMEAKYGQPFATLAAAYAHEEEVEMIAYQLERDQRVAAQAERDEMPRRGSPLPLITQWEHGDI